MSINLSIYLPIYLYTYSVCFVVVHSVSIIIISRPTDFKLRRRARDDGDKGRRGEEGRERGDITRGVK